MAARTASALEGLDDDGQAVAPWAQGIKGTLRLYALEPLLTAKMEDIVKQVVLILARVRARPNSRSRVVSRPQSKYK